MQVIAGRNVNDALPRALVQLNLFGVRRESRNGPVTVFRTPVTTIYTSPQERVLWNAERDANPFFHFFESLWMLAGRKDVRWISRFSKNIGQFSDDGKTFNGGYGFRWARHFGKDQVEHIVQALAKDPNDRRCVLQMWDGHHDLGLDSKDVPCNTAAYVWVGHDGALCLTVTNRSNDIVWGCYGANAVHFSMLQEYIAGRLGRHIGPYWQVSNNLHMYDFNKHQVRTVGSEFDQDGAEEPYAEGLVVPYPMMDNREDPKTWSQDLEMFMDEPQGFGYRHAFFSRVAKPLYFAYAAFSTKEDPERFKNALDILEQCHAQDWKLAAQQWIRRRQLRAEAREAPEQEKIV